MNDVYLHNNTPCIQLLKHPCVFIDIYLFFMHFIKITILTTALSVMRWLNEHK